MYLRSIATAVPPESLTQESCWATLKAGSLLTELRPRSIALLEKILTGGSSGIARRNFALHQFSNSHARSAEELNQAFEKEAAPLASHALLSALKKSGHVATDVDALFVCTCTGYLCPGVTSYLAEQMGMRADVYLADLVGLGCGSDPDDACGTRISGGKSNSRGRHSRR